ncbi:MULTISPECIES: methyl-accepting chemotaxis protein [Clostridium]|uniref:methyl-accepting chemotaxis protein n=1 Tax=Clostridium TaxID=1485 RepID=UPI000825D58B|nr:MULTISPECIES: methyl-accepting chemotaxis protein [Clostridium]PJI08205.1 methyl-accepting chemotaxis protein [Clostridium sp. CT7]
MNIFKNLKIGVKLSISFIIMILIAGVIGIVGLVQINTINTNDTLMYENNVEPLNKLVTITYDFGSIRARLRDVLMSSKQEDIKQYEDNINSYSDEFDAKLDEFSKTLSTDEGKRDADKLKSSKKEYMEGLKQAFELAERGNNQEAINLASSKLTAKQNDVQVALNNISNLKKEHAKINSESNDETASYGKKMIIVFIFIGAALGIILGIVISRSISVPIKKLIKDANAISEGDLNINISLDSKDEIGILAQAFKRMSEKLNDVLNSINASSNQVAIGSKQISDSSIALSQGAAEQASSVEELTSSIEEVSSQTNLNADNAKRADELSSNVKENAENGNEQMKQMLVSMEEINTSSENISKIIKVIDDIAFQTNILALNAAVEAARAGQHGKGFAVVAEEVRNLAARSANAAKETTEMIENSIKKVEQGTKIANETATALDDIVGGIGKVSDIIKQISTASTEQASALEQINQGVIQVSQVVQENSATSEESATASEELAGQAKLLQEQVSKFKLKKINEYSGPYNNEINPEVLSMLKSMSKNKEALRKDTAFKNVEKIDLSDNEFGKY